MSDPVPNADHAAEAPRRGRLRQWASGGWNWAAASRARMALAGAAGLVALSGVLAVWSFVARLAVESLKPATIEMALAALDAGDYDHAAAIISDMQSQAATPELVGGAMFVLGAVKARDADAETSGERRTAMSQIAARYLEQAHQHGVPAGRAAEAARLLGKCLVHGGDPEAAIPRLEEALALGAEPAVEIHSLLVRALLAASAPDLEAALAHNDFVVGDPALAGDARDEAWLQRAETLLRLGRTDDSLAALAQVTGGGAREGRRTLLMGRLEMVAAEALAGDSLDRPAKLDAAIQHLAAAQKEDAENGSLARQAIFWTARCYELRGDRDAALGQYKQLSNLYGDTDEGLAAALAEADEARLNGEATKALAGYRAVLQAVGNPLTYNNSLMPLDELRARLRRGYDQFVGDGLFPQSLAMLDLIAPVIGRVECMELRAKAHQAWGAAARAQAAGAGRKEAEQQRRNSRFHLRAAGLAYEDLARMRYATRYFTRDLWSAADCYFQGQSYTSAARLFADFLHEEARQWNDVALVRLGQSRLALGEFDAAIAALEECIELFPANPVTHQARLEAARAYQQLGNAAGDAQTRTAKFDEAERLLRENLGAVALTPESPEWRDSLFALGQLLFERERYVEAVDALREAVERYPGDEATLLAKYLVARAYHRDAEVLAAILRAPNSDNEALINRSRRQIGDDLEAAHAMYVDVQRTITLGGHGEDDPLSRMLLRNCYMMQGSVLMELRRYEEARQAYANVITLYQNDPVVLESFVQVANCWRRLDEPAMARGNLERAKVVLGKLPAEADFLASTNFDRQQWKLLLDEMSRW
jgi:tetratricopeptide (TPR) repeat protein